MTRKILKYVIFDALMYFDQKSLNYAFANSLIITRNCNRLLVIFTIYFMQKNIDNTQII